MPLHELHSSRPCAIVQRGPTPATNWSTSRGLHACVPIWRFAAPAGRLSAHSFINSCLWPAPASSSAPPARWPSLGAAAFVVHAHRPPRPERRRAMDARPNATASTAITRPRPRAASCSRAWAPTPSPLEPQVFEAAVRKLRGRLMPPPGEPQPEQPRVDSFIAWLERTIDRNAVMPRAGHVPIQRLNRTEYAAAVQDLVGVEIDAGRVPAGRDRGRRLRQHRGRAQRLAGVPRAVHRRRAPRRASRRRRAEAEGRERLVPAADRTIRTTTSTACRSARAAACASRTISWPTANTASRSRTSTSGCMRARSRASTRSSCCSTATRCSARSSAAARS